MSQYVSSPSSSYEQYFSSLLNIKNNNFELENYNYIPSVKNYLHICAYCDRLKNLCGFDKFVIAIIYGKQKIWLSNIPLDMMVSYHVHKLYHLDTTTVEENYAHKDHFIPTRLLANPVDLLYRKLIQEIYQVYTLYVLVREYFEATVLIYANSSTPLVEGLETIYERTHKTLENFAIQFLDDHIEIFGEYLPNLKYSYLYQNKSFRKNIMQRKFLEEIRPLTQQEMMCLHWAGYGKTAIEISLIVKISPHTVRQHLKVAIEKLNASNITHAVFKARNSGII